MKEFEAIYKASIAISLSNQPNSLRESKRSLDDGDDDDQMDEIDYRPSQNIKID